MLRQGVEHRPFQRRQIGERLGEFPLHIHQSTGVIEMGVGEQNRPQVRARFQVRQCAGQLWPVTGVHYGALAGGGVFQQIGVDL